jgi:thiamine-monophosphate kinase
MNGTVLELAAIDRLTQGLPRAPLQLNRVHETDAELLPLSRGGGEILAITTDTIAEEIAAGLYGPCLAGWMVVMASLSDLAAVGATPLGMVVSEVFPAGMAEASRRAVQSGIAAACRRSGTSILGGDTSSGAEMILTGTAFGRVARRNVLMRCGCTPGDLLFSTGPLGRGNAFALARMRGGVLSPLSYRPVAQLRAGRILGGTASACMDTSDGVLASVDQLTRINDVGCDLLYWEEALDGRSAATMAHAGLPSWLLLAGEHGEFQLVYTISPGREPALRRRARASGWSPRPLGIVTRHPVVRLVLNGRLTPIDTGLIRNLPADHAGDPGGVCAALLALHRDLTAERVSNERRES